MGKIRLLPENIANQIAAGEVVQRPASVVKELLENAIDADAKHIKLIVKDGGKSLVQVVDDGSGMDETDARMSFERHATSKIRSSEDLFRIVTKGFRGEALASIAAVAHVEMKTKPPGRPVGTFIRIEGGKITAQEPVQTQAGTSVAVKNLFFNVPARRKFLKSPQVEMRHIIDEFQRVALAYPEREFTLIHNGNEVYRLFPGNTLQRITAIFGKKIEERILPLHEETDYIKINAYVGKPEFAKLKRGEQFFFVNRRFIKSPYLHSAVMKAYEGLLQEKRIPAYFIFFEIDPQHIDINIHPTKTEIKFDDEYTVYNILTASVRRALGQFNQMPSLDFDADPSLNFDAIRSKKIPREPKISVDPSFNPFKENTSEPGKTTFRKPSSREIENFTELLNATSPHENPPVFTSGVFDENNSATGENLSLQWNDKFIVTFTRSGLVIIRQYPAHVSVLYEDFIQKLAGTDGSIPSQQLMFPLEPGLLPGEIEIIEQNKHLFLRAGFRWQTDGNKIGFTAIPSGLNDSQSSEVIEKLLADISDDIPSNTKAVNRIIAMTLAKSAAVKSGQKLNEEARQNLIARLFSLPEPRISPCGKKNFIILNSREIENKFQ
jgi:DNA mismatch repair protein MutL